MTDILDNIENLHTTEMGAERIKRNLQLSDCDAVLWCKNAIVQGIHKSSIKTERKGKNWYVYIADIVFTINANSLTIITAHIHVKRP